jgi:hypothetical protein
MELLNTYDFESYEEAARESFAEFGEDASEDDITRRAYSLMADDESIIFDDLARYFKYDKLLMIGTCGTWRGVVDGGKIGSFEELARDLLKDCGFIKITDERGRLVIRGTHHDGTNEAEFVKLTERGAALFNNWNYNFDDDRSERDIHAIIYKSNLFSKIPHFAREVYGVKEKRA